MSITLPAIITTAALFLLFSVLPLPAGCDPVASDWPFVILWNAPTRPCLTNHSVSLDLEDFDIIINQNQSFLGPELVIFYMNQLGLYPYYTQAQEPVTGGLPQNSSLEGHLAKGWGVVDWEEWRPLWDWNWENMTRYHLMSLRLVNQRHPDWPYGKLRRLAKRQFEAAAREFMASTLQMALRLRPGGLWGFYGFPNCYNYGYKNCSHNYTGRCPEDVMRSNDAMDWLWGISRALYPQIYLERDLRDSEHVGPYVRYRVQEGLRVSAIAEVPVLPYARIAYTYSMDFLTQDDLMKTIGQSSALGASGVVLWGNNDFSCSKESCLAVKGYIEEKLAPYLKNITTAAILCSHALCSGNGRCAHKFSDSDIHLHLDP
uniref:Hyaluronidase n=1 Tax=Pyxicephalus adspersus TaxID=30357 RepID=A0AAV2ZKI3_PYXAD|nr:TPA: hypothetical protein GDO54_016614 [Pyxicephalus adspersus]